MPTPKPVEIGSASEPYEARLNYQSQQINQLTRQNVELKRQCSNNSELITSLRGDKQAIEARASLTVKSLHEEYKAERQEWKQTCDKLGGRSRLADLDTKLAIYNLKLEQERWNETFRQQGIAVMARDFKITEFQVMELDRERHILALRKDVHGLQKLNDRLATQCSVLETELKNEQEQSQTLDKETTTLKGDLEALRKENQTLIKQHKTLSLSSQTVDRLRLELDGARSDNITLESQMSEFRKANTDLKRQMEQWKRLEERGDEEAKAKVELEVAKEELEERLQESSRKEKDSQKELRRMRSLLEDFKRKQKESDSSVLRVQDELDRAHLELRELRESSGSNAVTAARAANDSSDNDSEKDYKTKLSAVKKPQKASQLTHPTRNRPQPSTSKRTKATADFERPKRETQRHVETDDEDTELDREVKRSRVQKTMVRVDEVESNDQGEKDDASDGNARKRGLDVHEYTQQKRGKRKLNVVGEGPSSFSWGSLSGGSGGLSIPTELSPIKDSSVVPKRSTSLLGRLASHMF